jgi:4-amino-4-deoxy-L-arabinose transferase-like glycosyltransferase
MVAIVVLTLVRALVAANAGLVEDEAYYRLWALAPAMSYLDHPPMVAWMIWAGRAIAGDTELGIRLPSLLTGLVGPFILWRTALILFSGEVARRAVWLSLAMPLLAVGGIIITPDTPSVLFWGLVGWALAELYVSQRAGWWLAVGLLAGLGLLSKYTNLFVGAGIALWLILLPANWRWLRSWQLWAGGAIAGLLTLPVVVWNANHGWASFAKQFGRVGAGEGLTAKYLVEFLGAYIGLASPIIAILAVLGLCKVVSQAISQSDQPRSLLALGMLPLLAYLLVHTLHDRVQANWAAPLYPALAICAALAVSEVERSPFTAWHLKRLMPWGVGLGLAISALIFLHALRPLVVLPGARDPTSQMRGWEAFAAEVDRLRIANGACWIATSSFETTGQLAWALRSRVPVLQLDEPLRYVHLPKPDRGLLQCPALYVELERRLSPELLSRHFRSLTLLPGLSRSHRGVDIARYVIYRLADPIQPLPRAGP